MFLNVRDLLNFMLCKKIIVLIFCPLEFFENRTLKWVALVGFWIKIFFHFLKFFLHLGWPHTTWLFLIHKIGPPYWASPTSRDTSPWAHTRYSFPSFDKWEQLGIPHLKGYFPLGSHKVFIFDSSDHCQRWASKTLVGFQCFKLLSST